MTIDIEKLEALAKASAGEWYEVGELRYEDRKSGDLHGLHHDDERFIAAANPAVVLELIAEVKRNQRMLVAACASLGDIGEALGADMDDDVDHLIGMINQLREGRESQQRTCIRAMEERDRLRAENEALRGLYEMHKQTETREMRELKAELADLKTGYEAYEQLNAELRAECEALRKDAARYNWVRSADPDDVDYVSQQIGHVKDEYIDSAMSKERGPEESEPNSGHGHVFKRPDGKLARCGGPGLCKDCSVDLEKQVRTK